MLRVDLRETVAGGVATNGQLAADDPALEGLEATFTAPIEVAGMLSASSGDNFRWQAHLRAVVRGECRRCLTAVDEVIEDDVDVIFSSDEDLLDDPAVYELPVNAVALDLTAAVREELALRVSAFPLCRPDCKGLCAGCGADLNAGPCACSGTSPTS
ncbi:MAG: DUF177 domain-containing protein [Gemmatimonadales bacterium]|nr:DUF177 domain-containing protein [Gemmatimonadales bacterium]MDZ4391101.1 DUF177 domain-containing protein [Gemmatimonadales bacterium]